ncbi:K+-transporting ATPase ATPase C chain [Tistlia consotensis]|uniref:Potassium-transporting ATPase KdpC subunit n=1 Tax=Tistlia consotensis USBA 355 TaxID=560819 RepID=A0A1Y6BK78_9PROT|nr:potassium-transporting ATPase subunit KdpC [Tistlia consotensis]SMF05401.1 K+-transporting ATPase ATPase C chain [Tistlia consotensis USBA 355]SNR55290.1 K+-transporting ATPase ATPase C chain [Tistlia consotensis]
MLSQIRPALVMMTVMLLLTGVAYPLGVTALAQLVFPDQAHGSLVERDGRVIGSRLVGQPFAGAGYFHPRPSAAGAGYDAAASGGSNLGPTSSALLARVNAAAGRLSDEAGGLPVPVDLVTTSGSGLDPDISPAAAQFQAPRVAGARGLTLLQVRRLVRAQTAGRTFGLFGEPRVNVLQLNLALDALTATGEPPPTD